VEDPVAVEGRNGLDEILNKSAFAGAIRAHYGDEQAGGLQPSANKTHAIGKQVRYQPQWISCEACLPRLVLNLCEERVQSFGGTRLNDAYLECAKEDFTG
jgi:hypothetical protein